ncbi:MAG: phosphoribosylformylglycinamidine synthase subunit PurS [Fibrobacterales bacterium]
MSREIHRITVKLKAQFPDPKGNRIMAAMHEDLGIDVEAVKTIQVFTTCLDESMESIDHIAQELFHDPVVEEYSIDSPLAESVLDFDWLFEIGFKPGVTDNVGRSSREGINDILGRKLEDLEDIWTSYQVLVKGDLTAEQAEEVCVKFLANPLIETYEIIARKEWDAGKRVPAADKHVKSEHVPTTKVIELPATGKELLDLSNKMILSLNEEEMLAIKNHYTDEEIKKVRREHGLSETNPTDMELEILAQTWSEHCSHKIFAADVEYTDEEGNTQTINSLFKTYIYNPTKEITKGGDFIKSVFWDNAGIIKFTEDWSISIKAETHNSPSALDPFGGAMTGIVGVNRDIIGTGIGTKPIFNTDVFCFASPFYDGEVPTKLMHPRQIFKGVHAGVRDGGNESGIPVVNGSIVFDERFMGKPLVFCGTGGLVPAKINGKPSEDKEIKPGDRIVMAGGRIGKDGIHGATFSSVALTEDSPVSAVQIGDPITQKKMLDFIIEARDLGLYRFMTDNGAGGLSSSLGEMAEPDHGANGAHIDLTNAPLKYAGLDPWEIIVSEAQERMSLAVPPENMAELQALADLRGVEIADLGEFTNTGYFRVDHDGEIVCMINMEFMHDGAPKLKLKANFKTPVHSEPETFPEDLNDIALKLLGRLNICSKESWVRQYDHEVQGMSVTKPFTGEKNDGPSDAAVIRPLPDQKEGLIVAHGILPRYSDIDTYHMTASVIDEAVRSVIASGGKLDYIAGLDNFCWPDPVQSEETPDGEYKMGQLVRSNQALSDYCKAYNLPCISGKDSMKNDYGKGDEKISIPPTLLFTVIAKMDDVEKSVTIDAKKAGDLVYVVGQTRAELGGSEYYAELGHVGNSVPVVNTNTSIPLYRALTIAIESELVASAHDISDGGLWVTLAETAFAGRLGMDIDLTDLDCLGDLTSDEKLFSETQSRLVITVSAANKGAFEKAMIENSISCIGTVTDAGSIKVKDGDDSVIDLTVDETFSAWHKTVNWD